MGPYESRTTSHQPSFRHKHQPKKTRHRKSFNTLKTSALQASRVYAVLIIPALFRALNLNGAKFSNIPRRFSASSCQLSDWKPASFSEKNFRKLSLFLGVFITTGSPHAMYSSILTGTANNSNTSQKS